MNYSCLLKRRVVQCAYLCCLATLSTTWANVARATISSPAVKNAVARRVCFEGFWWGRKTFAFGQTVPIVVRDVGNKAYVWSERLSAVPHVTVWANFFSVFSSGRRVMVGESSGYNVDTLKKTALFKKRKALVFDGPHSTLMFRVPRNCVPTFERSSPRKRLMLKVIESSVIQELNVFRKHGDQNMPNRLRIIIANFNVDDPATEVLVPSARYVFYVALHMASNPFSNRFLRQGRFPVQPEYSKQAIAELAPKIEKYGIVRVIRLSQR